MIKRVGDMFYGVESLEQLRARVQANGHPLTALAATPPAYVNGGRWLTICPSCNNGVPVDPSWTATVCVDCGSTYSPIFPDADRVAEIEAALEGRLPANQNWLPGETVDDLLAENDAHGVAMPRSGP